MLAQPFLSFPAFTISFISITHNFALGEGVFNNTHGTGDLHVHNIFHGTAKRSVVGLRFSDSLKPTSSVVVVVVAKTPSRPLGVTLLNNLLQHARAPKWKPGTHSGDWRPDTSPR
ncbi:hypothetical protein B0H17DRAFT_512559 [Mycena rosella]|uniref:Uncharacterized protein n=1 Tax=Mycena rosella TaxID=1033263 RepID=A0AAD7DLB9_MYCRO|nr:hypothetical protein B0H17DRAFT_512559 [Mycena rosella]